jgi:hypothetical protein
MRVLSLMGGHGGVSGARDLSESKALAGELRLLLTGPAR